MAGEKYVVATAENPFHIAIRNILNPCGYMFLGNCGDSLSLLRLVRSYSPEFIVVDLGMQWRELKHTIETIDEEMLCCCILIGDYKDIEVTSLLENSSVISFCHKPVNRDMLVHTVDMAIINYKRVFQLNKKLKEATENYETRKLVERAKHILMTRDNISENEAYTRMRKKSMDTRVSMKAIAEAIIFTHELGGKK
ncbi:MAG: ANTAR domain-containing response regulator [Bacillota bacterium]